MAHFFDDYSKNYDISFIFELCNSLKLECFKKGKVVFAQNDPSNNKLYVILSGHIIVHKKEDLDQIVAIHDQKSTQDISNTPNMTPRMKTQEIKSAIHFPHMNQLGRSDSIKREAPPSVFMRPPKNDTDDESDEPEDSTDGEILIDQSQWGHKKENFMNFSASNSRKTISFQNLGDMPVGNIMMNSTANLPYLTSPEFKKSRMGAQFGGVTNLGDDTSILAKWSSQISGYLANVVKKPFRVMKSEIISPNALESITFFCFRFI